MLRVLSLFQLVVERLELVRLFELGCLLLACRVLILSKLGSFLLWQADFWAETSVDVWIVVIAGMLHHQAEVRSSTFAIFALTGLGHFIKVNRGVVGGNLMISNLTHTITVVFVQASVDAFLGLRLRHLDPPTHQKFVCIAIWGWGVAVVSEIIKVGSSLRLL